MLIPGKRIVGALLGGWVATKLFHIHTIHGFFNLSTWLTAIAGAAVLLVACHLVSGQSSSRAAGSHTAESRGGAPALGLPPGGVPASAVSTRRPRRAPEAFNRAGAPAEVH